jgi:hypothetical protein
MTSRKMIFERLKTSAGGFIQILFAKHGSLEKLVRILI